MLAIFFYQICTIFVRILLKLAMEVLGKCSGRSAKKLLSWILLCLWKSWLTVYFNITSSYILHSNYSLKTNVCVCWAFLMFMGTRSKYTWKYYFSTKKKTRWPSPANHQIHQMTTAPTKFTKARGILGWHRFGRHRFQRHLSSLSSFPSVFG